MKKKLNLPKLKISTKPSSSIQSPFTSKRSNTPQQTMSPYSTTSLDGRSTSRPAAKRKSRFGLIKAFQRNSVNNNNNFKSNNLMKLPVKAKCESPRKFSTISTVSTMAPQQQEIEKPEQIEEPQFELKYEASVNINHPDLQFIFDQTNLDYYKEGNAAFYTPEMKNARQLLKQQVQKSIERFINDCFPLTDEFTLSKQNYFQVFFRIACILRPSLYKNSKFSEIKKVLENDWIRDNKGKNQCTMQKEDLKDSIWELIDIWTPDVNEELYVGFLETLKMKFILPLWNLGENSEKKISIYDIM